MIGIIPAAGSASRMFGLPKMLLPTPDGVLIDILAERMGGVCDHLFTGTRSGLFGMLSHRLTSDRHTVYLANTATMSQTVLAAERFAGDQPVAFGMPDTWFEDDQVFVKLAGALEAGADVAVGVFRARYRQHLYGGMVDIHEGRVRDVIDKPAESGLAWIWGALAWKPVLWPLIHPADPHVGYALPRAIAKHLDVRPVFCNGPYWDCGTPEAYFDCIAAQRVAVPALAG
jgi:UTP-glucose-1-phosphate uridylyltransferase